jgi:predicted AlkP superfamily phosphohydrolase/phosphomutase
MGSGDLECLVVGLDAATPPVLERLFDEDATPTLESIFDRGIGDTLRSQIPPWTPSA